MTGVTSNRNRFVRLAILGCVMLMFTACNNGNASAGSSTVMPCGGLVLDPPHTISDATLTDQAGHTTHLFDWPGRVALWVFRYTYWPGVCPITVGGWTLVT